MRKKLLSIIVPLMFLIIGDLHAQTTINSLTELKSHLDDSNGNFVMTPGTYYFNASNCGPGKLFSSADILLFTGSNSTFDFTGVKFEFDTDIFAIYTSWAVNFWPTGNNNVYLNLTMENIGNTVPNAGGEAIHFDGNDNRIEGFHITVRSSYPYGYGDIFGKGGGSVIGHKKRAGILVRGDRNHVKNCTVLMRSYGHGIFMQGAEDALIEGCYVEGETRTVKEVLAEEGTNSPADNVDFMTVWGYDLRDLDHDYRFSLQEDGIRSYTTGSIYGTDESRSTTGTQVVDCKVVQMRSGVTIGWDYTAKRVENCTVLACETGYWFGSNTTAIDCKGDASLGPLISEDVGRSDSTIDLTLVDNYLPKIGNTPYFYFAGNRHQLTLHDGTTSFNSDVKIQVGGKRVAHRWLEGSGEEPLNKDATNLNLINKTKYPVLLESNASNNTIVSCGLVTNNGSNNSITLSTDCDYDRSCSNTADNLQAECFDDMFGIQKEAIGTNNEQIVSDIHANDWIAYNNINLTNITSVEVIASTTQEGVAIEVREGSNTGTLLATIPVSSTSSFDAYETFSADLTQTVTGETTIYFVFTGVGDLLLNLDKVSFRIDTCSEASYDPILPIGAEEFCDASEVSLIELENFNQAVSEINDGDYLKFSNVNFGDYNLYNSIRILGSSNSEGGSIEVRSGSIDGELLTTVNVTNTGSWDEYSVFNGYTAEYISGTHDIYFVFSGTSETLMRVDGFSFLYDQCAGMSYQAYDKIEAEDFCETGGIEVIGNYVGNVQSGDWMRFSDVDFTSSAPLSVTLSLSGYSSEGYVDVRLDNPKDGLLIASTTVTATGGWTSWEEFSVDVNQPVTGVHDVYIYFGDTGNNMNWFQFKSTAAPVPPVITYFSPDPTKTYYIENPKHKLRLGSDGQSLSAYTITSTNTGIDLEWKFVDNGNGFWHIERAAGGTYTRFSSKNTGVSEMRVTSSNNEFTYYKIIENDANNRYFIDLANVSSNYKRLQVNTAGVISFVPDSYEGSWEEVNIIEVLNSKLSSGTINELNVTAYPNPVENIVTIVGAINSLVKVYDVSGKVIITKDLGNSEILDISTLPSGFYYAELTRDGKKSILKLIKK